MSEKTREETREEIKFIVTFWSVAVALTAVWAVISHSIDIVELRTRLDAIEKRLPPVAVEKETPK